MNGLLYAALFIGLVVGMVAYYVWERRKKERERQEALAQLSDEQRHELEAAAKATARRNGLMTAVLGVAIGVLGVWSILSAQQSGGVAFYGAAIVGAIMAIAGFLQFVGGRKL